MVTDISRRSAMGWFGALLLPWAPEKEPSGGLVIRVVAEEIQGDTHCYAGYVTWVDGDYDEKTHAAIEPLLGDQRDIDWMRLAISRKDA